MTTKVVAGDNYDAKITTTDDINDKQAKRHVVEEREYFGACSSGGVTRQETLAVCQRFSGTEREKALYRKWYNEALVALEK